MNCHCRDPGVHCQYSTAVVARLPCLVSLTFTVSLFVLVSIGSSELDHAQLSRPTISRKRKRRRKFKRPSVSGTLSGDDLKHAVTEPLDTFHLMRPDEHTGSSEETKKVSCYSLCMRFFSLQNEHASTPKMMAKTGNNRQKYFVLEVRKDTFLAHKLCKWPNSKL